MNNSFVKCKLNIQLYSYLFEMRKTFYWAIEEV